MSEREQNGARALRGMQAICLHPDYPHGLTVEVAASDIIADVLHAQAIGDARDTRARCSRAAFRLAGGIGV